MENNTVKITGKIMETPEYLLTSPDRRKIYKSTIEVMLLFGKLNAAVSIRLKRVFQST